MHAREPKNKERCHVDWRENLEYPLNWKKSLFEDGWSPKLWFQFGSWYAKGLSKSL